MSPFHAPFHARGRTSARRLVLYSVLVLSALLGFFGAIAGCMALKAEQLRREREAIAGIEKLGGIVRWDWQYTKNPSPQSPGPAWLKRLLGDNCCAAIESIDATKRFGDDAMKRLKDLREVHILRLGGSAVTDVGLQHLKDARGLQTLLLDRTKVTDAGLRHIEALPKLEWLDLGETRITDAGLKHVARLTGLRHLFLDRTQISDAGLEEIKGLTALGMLGCTRTNVTKAGEKLQQALPHCMIVP